MIKNLSCEGFRGFSTEQSISLGIPNGQRGSGLTTLIGPNGGGKSTLVEAFSKFTPNNISFTEGKLNKLAGDKVSISITNEKDQISIIQTVKSGGSEIERINTSILPQIYYLPARRVFSPYFGKNPWTRETYLQNPEQTQFRANVSNNFTYRLFTALENAKEYNKVFWRVLGKELNWTIDQNDTNQYYIKVLKENTLSHNSDGLGEDVVSLMFICDALYDAKENETIVIDEPELSLHPQLQLRLLDEILEFTKNNQIVISTHSPIMMSIESAINGGVIARVHENKTGSVINFIDEKCRGYFRSFTGDRNNPHVMGNDARASLFSDDSLLLTEGQEDVILIPKILDQLSLDYTLPFSVLAPAVQVK